MKTKGFTLVELLVVIAILAILATVSVVGYTSYINNANSSAAQQELAQIKTAALAYELTTTTPDGAVDSTELAAALETEELSAYASYVSYGKVGEEVVVKYNNTKGVAYWNLTTGVISTTVTGWTEQQ